MKRMRQYKYGLTGFNLGLAIFARCGNWALFLSLFFMCGATSSKCWSRTWTRMCFVFNVIIWTEVNSLYCSYLVMQINLKIRSCGSVTPQSKLVSFSWQVLPVETSLWAVLRCQCRTDKYNEIPESSLLIYCIVRRTTHLSHGRED